jgi:hypothetical protein
VIATVTDLASSIGARLVGFIQAGAGAVIRSLESKMHIKDFGAICDGTTDDTAAIQLAVNSGHRVIDYGDSTICVNGQVTLTSDQTHIANGAELVRTVPENAKSFFYGDGVDNVGFDGLRMISGVVRGGPGYASTAACVRVKNCSDISFNNVYAAGGASGIQVDACEGLTVRNSELTGNILTGISGIANHVLIENTKSYNNGYSALGQTHEIYFLNSRYGRVHSCQIGPHVDPTSAALVLRYDESGSSGDFNTLADWVVDANSFDTNGIKVGSDPGVVVANRKPPTRVSILGNTYSNGAGLWIDDPEDCESSGNRGMTALTCRVATNWAGYAMGYTSVNDECVTVTQAALAAVRLVARDKIVFNRLIINNAAATAFNNDATFGGNPACTIIEPNITGTGTVFDTAFLARYQTNLEVLVTASKTLRYLDRRALTLDSTNPMTPNNHAVGMAPFYVALSAALTTVNAPVVAATGMTIDFLLRNNGGAGRTVTFDAAYKLSSATTAVINASVLNNRMYLRFIYETGAWRQMGDASWTAP